MNYENKYRKYKIKYLQMKKLIGGSNNILNFMYNSIINNEIHVIQKDKNDMIISLEKELLDQLNVFYFLQQNDLEKFGIYNSKILLIDEANYSLSNLGKNMEILRPDEHKMLPLIRMLIYNCYWPIIISKRLKEDVIFEYLKFGYEKEVVNEIVKKHYINIPCINLLSLIKNDSEKVKYGDLIELLNKIKDKRISISYQQSCYDDTRGERDDILLLILSKYFMEQRVGQEVYIATNDYFKNFGSIKNNIVKMIITYDCGENISFNVSRNLESYSFIYNATQ